MGEIHTVGQLLELLALEDPEAEIIMLQGNLRYQIEEIDADTEHHEGMLLMRIRKVTMTRG